jgi:CRISPR-associated endonuclease/helicase Cas3
MPDETRETTASGVPIKDKLVTELGKGPRPATTSTTQLRRRGGRPRIGSAPASVESVRLDPELSEALTLEPNATTRRHRP